jgi:hypothetical protein
MRSFQNYDWMLGPGLGLKGLALSLFALTASYNRAGKKMYESRGSLAGYLGYSERQIGKALQSLVADGLLACERGVRHREFCINFQVVQRILETKDTKDNPVLSSLNDYMRNRKPMEKEEEQSSAPGEKKVPVQREQSSRTEVKKVPVQKEQSSCSGENKVPVIEEQSSPNNIYDNIYDNLINNFTYNELATMSPEDYKELLLPTFFFKNNCDPESEIDFFVNFYKGKGWTLSGGKTMTTKEELQKAAEAWRVKEPKDTGFRPSFMKCWKEAYKIVPMHLRKDFIRVSTVSQGQLHATIKCSEELTRWLNQEKELIMAIVNGQMGDRYKIEWI